MKPHEIARINELARKKKAEGLNPDEHQEHQELRQRYLTEYRENMRKMLDSIVVQEEDGTRHPLKKKPPQS